MKRLGEEDIQWLTERLADLGFSKPNMFEYLEGCIGMEIIPYYQYQRFGDDHMSWQLRIKQDKETSMYFPECFNAILVKTHPIKHARFEGIDTAHLEAQLKSVNWEKYRRPPIEVENMTTRTIDEVLRLQASKNKDAQDIARRLQVRYWLHTPVEQHIGVAQHLYRFEKRMTIALHNTMEDITAKEAYNLLCGRGVLKFAEDTATQNRYIPYWQQVVGNKLITVPQFDVMAELKKLQPIELGSYNAVPQLFYSLSKGELRPVHLPDAPKKLLYISANPAKQAINLYDENMSPVLASQITAKENKPDATKPQAKKSFRRKPGKRTGRSL